LTSPAFLGGLFIGVLSALPIVSMGNCCCLWIIGGGMLAAYLAQQSDRNPITNAQGATLGLLAGVIGAVVWIAASLAMDVVMGPFQERLISRMLETSADMPPELRGWWEEVGQRASSPLRYAIGFVFHLVAGVIFSTLGGVLGAVFFRRVPSPLPPASGDQVLPPPLPPQ
jgi:hypothetical protein